MLLSEFEKLVNGHDLTYAYSDDRKWYERGYASEKLIKREAKNFNEEEVKRIWNAKVDREIIEGHREGFYWK